MKSALRLTVTLVMAAVLFSVGFSLRDLRLGKAPDMQAFSALVGGEPGLRASVVFRDELAKIEQNYGLKADREDLRSAAFNGMFSSTGDPYTVFMPAQVAESFTLETRGDFVGIGARLADDPLGARIVTVFKGSPASGAGLKPGDIISEVDKQVLAGMTVEDIVDLIKGEEGSQVSLGITREGAAEPLKRRITRQTVIVPTAEGRFLEEQGVGYISLSGFSETTPAQLKQALVDALPSGKGAKGVVIDLRDNPGGLLDSAVDMLGLFLDDKPVVFTKGKGLNETYRSPKGQAVNTPVVVLINEGSASASEIFAGALQEHKRARLVGEHTYGKASVQTAHSVLDGALAKVTIARYYLPSGANISRKQTDDGEYISGGIKPDIEVGLPTDSTALLGEPGKDPQLDAAIKALKG